MCGSSQRSIFLLCLCFSLFAFSCRPDNNNNGGDSGTENDSDQRDSSTDEDSTGDDSSTDSAADSDEDSGEITDCVEEARWIYLVGSGNALVRFYPDELRLETIGTLNCTGSAQPFSMSVDRDATAWVLHDDGRIFHVSTTDASCSTTTFVPHQHNLEVFGMGFVSLYEGSEEEVLYVGGGPESSIATGNATLAVLNTDSLEVTTVGQIPGWPELTGTARGDLWGFFPDTVPPSVRQIDKESGNTIQTFDLEPLRGMTAQAWAFAFWGGNFYIFLQRLMDTSTHIWMLNPEDGSVTNVVPNTGYRIVGAGVSTCAPVILI